MNNIFNIKRFCNYFLYDLRNAKNNYGLSLLILGIMPVVLFIIVQLFSLIFTRDVAMISLGVKYAELSIVSVVAMIGAGVKIYGKLTEKQSGSNFLMIPASTLEKWLSMNLIVCLVVPAVLYALQFATDGLMSFLFPNTYGERVFLFENARGALAYLNDNGVQINVFGLLALSWAETILTFTLGALCFKKSKVAKTILVLIAASFVLSIGMVAFNINDLSYPNYIGFSNATEFVSYMNWTASISYAIFIGGLLCAIYFRLRTLKH